MDAGVFAKLEKQIPKLLSALREDIKTKPTCRRFVLLGQNWGYFSDSLEFQYYYEDFEDLRSEVTVLEEYGLVKDVTATNVQQFRFSNKLVDYALEQIPGTPAIPVRLETVLSKPPSARLPEPDLERLIQGKAHLDVPVAARYLGLSHDHVRRLVREGKLIKIGQGRRVKIAAESLRAYKGT
jgi:excisionase family DNA binding protein